MANFADTLTISSTGSGASAISITGLGFQPNELHFTVGAKSGSTTANQLCVSDVDSSGFMTYVSTNRDGTNVKAVDGTTKCLSVWEWNGSAWVEVISASFNSYTASGFKLNVTVTSTSYNVHYFASN